MKNTLIILLLLIINITAFSQTVNNDEITKVAINYYKFLTKDDTTKQNVEIVKQKMHTFKGVETYANIVFDNNDWISISTDKSIDPILAFSDEGSYADSINANAKFWFELYDYYVYNAKHDKIYEEDDKNKDYQQLWNDLLANDLEKYTQKNLGSDITPLTTTKWGQSVSNTGNDPYAYNYYAPCGTDVYGNNCEQEHALAGCPAVAAGQILRYWEYPNCPVYNWNNMPNTLDAGNANYSQYKNEIANLLRNLADKMQDYMDSHVYHNFYGCYGSGTNSVEAILYPIKNDCNFNNAYIVAKSDYSLNDWKKIIYDELNNYRPVLYTGYRTNGGHAFVCEGYKHVFLGDRFYFNFGWNGNNDGYYKIVNPQGFTENQMAIINIYPPQQVNCNTQKTIFQIDKILDANKYYNPKAGTILSSPNPITIAHNDVVRYEAYNEIVLTNFETEESADFIAKIVPCPITPSIDCSIFYDYKSSFKSLTTSDNENDLTDNTVLENNSIEIYPNPFNDIITISFYAESQPSTIKVFNCLGKLVLEKHIVSKELKINLSGQPSGIYLLKYSSGNSNYQQTIIKK